MPKQTPKRPQRTFHASVLCADNDYRIITIPNKPPINTKYGEFKFEIVWLGCRDSNPGNA